MFFATICSLTSGDALRLGGVEVAENAAVMMSQICAMFEVHPSPRLRRDFFVVLALALESRDNEGNVAETLRKALRTALVDDDPGCRSVALEFFHKTLPKCAQRRLVALLDFSYFSSSRKSRWIANAVVLLLELCSESSHIDEPMHQAITGAVFEAASIPTSSSFGSTLWRPLRNRLDAEKVRNTSVQRICCFSPFNALHFSLHFKVRMTPSGTFSSTLGTMSTYIPSFGQVPLPTMVSLSQAALLRDESDAQVDSGIVVTGTQQSYAADMKHSSGNRVRTFAGISSLPFVFLLPSLSTSTTLSLSSLATLGETSEVRVRS